MRVPLVYTALELRQWHVDEKTESGQWIPARPCPFYGVGYMMMRLRITWRVFIGRYDAMNWQGTGERSSQEATYRDILSPDFWTKSTPR